MEYSENDRTDELSLVKHMNITWLRALHEYLSWRFLDSTEEKLMLSEQPRLTFLHWKSLDRLAALLLVGVSTGAVDDESPGEIIKLRPGTTGALRGEGDWSRVPGLRLPRP